MKDCIWIVESDLIITFEFFNRASDTGISPCRLLDPTSRTSIEEIFPKEWGIVPSKLFFSRFSRTSFDK